MSDKSPGEAYAAGRGPCFENSVLENCCIVELLLLI